MIVGLKATDKVSDTRYHMKETIVLGENPNTYLTHDKEHSKIDADRNALLMAEKSTHRNLQSTRMWKLNISFSCFRE